MTVPRGDGVRMVGDVYDAVLQGGVTDVEEFTACLQRKEGYLDP